MRPEPLLVIGRYIPLATRESSSAFYQRLEQVKKGKGSTVGRI